MRGKVQGSGNEVMRCRGESVLLVLGAVEGGADEFQDEPFKGVPDGLEGVDEDEADEIGVGVDFEDVGLAVGIQADVEAGVIAAAEEAEGTAGEVVDGLLEWVFQGDGGQDLATLEFAAEGIPFGGVGVNGVPVRIGGEEDDFAGG
jgi:hypothetical protein